MVGSAGYEWFLPAVIASFHSRPIKFFTGFAMMIATLGNQIGQSPPCFAIILILGN
jgi:nucleobase:cation symporter-1, NCS1 family